MKFLALLFATASMAVAQTNETLVSTTNDLLKARVTGDRVSLRAEPNLEGYLLDRVMRGEELVCLGKTNGWVAVQAPETLDFWISGEFVRNGVVQPEKLNVRAGPSLNYPVVAVLNGGDTVSLRGEFNAWLKIVPPPSSRVWISEDYVEFIQPPAPEPIVEAAPEPELVQETSSETKPEPEAETTVVPEQETLPPLMLVLDKAKKQGVYVEIPGVLRRANPGLYKLVLIDGGFEEPICLVRGRESQMEHYLNRSMLIKGKRYWAKDVDLPVVQPELIHLDPIIND